MRQKDLGNILTKLDEEQAHGADKMNKEQSADDPSVDLIRCKKYMLNSTISMSYPDVVIVRIEHKVSLEASTEQLRQRW